MWDSRASAPSTEVDGDLAEVYGVKGKLIISDPFETLCELIHSKCPFSLAHLNDLLFRLLTRCLIIVVVRYQDNFLILFKLLYNFDLDFHVFKNLILYCLTCRLSFAPTAVCNSSTWIIQRQSARCMPHGYWKGYEIRYLHCGGERETRLDRSPRKEGKRSKLGEKIHREPFAKRQLAACLYFFATSLRI